MIPPGFLQLKDRERQPINNNQATGVASGCPGSTFSARALKSAIADLRFASLGVCVAVAASFLKLSSFCNRQGRRSQRAERRHFVVYRFHRCFRHLHEPLHQPCISSGASTSGSDSIG
jgi:hypothetical protein